MEVVECVRTELANYFKSKLPSDLTILDDFPKPGKKLIYPTLSIFGSEPTFELKQPQFFGYMDKLGTTAKVESLYIVADVLLPIQLDLWCMSKEQRRFYLDVCTKILFPSPDIRSDLNLVLSTYHNIHVNYELSESIKFQESGQEGMISDYRAIINLNCSTSYIVTKEEYKFLHLYIHVKREDEVETDDFQVF